MSTGSRLQRLSQNATDPRPEQQACVRRISGGSSLRSRGQPIRCLGKARIPVHAPCLPAVCPHGVDKASPGVFLFLSGCQFQPLSPVLMASSHPSAFQGPRLRRPPHWGFGRAFTLISGRCIQSIATGSSGCFFFLRFYLFMHERHRERGRDTGRGRNGLPVGSPMWDSIPGL